MQYMVKWGYNKIKKSINLKGNHDFKPHSLTFVFRYDVSHGVTCDKLKLHLIVIITLREVLQNFASEEYDLNMRA